MMRTRRRDCSGYLTVYVSLTLTVLISLCLVLIEGVRRSTIRLETECVMDVGLNSVLAEYHRELFKQYNLFAIDSSYGTAYPSYYNTEARLRYYLEQNLDYDSCRYFSFLYKDFLAMELKGIQLTQASLLTDGDGSVFRQSAVEAMRDEVGLELLEQLLSWVQTVEGQGLLDRDVEAEKDAVDARLRKYPQLSGETWNTVEIQNPTEAVNRMRSAGALRWVVEDVEELSAQSVLLEQYPSARRSRGELNRGTGGGEQESGLAEEMFEAFLFREYLLRYSGCYTGEKQESLLKYQTEYLIAGEAGDRDNLKSVVNRICAVREAANVIYLMGDEEKRSGVQLISQVLSAALMVPEAQPLFETAILLGWAYLESLYDVRTLLAGGGVPLLKQEKDWHYGLDNIFESPETDSSLGNSDGLSYVDYLRILLYLADAQQLTFRFLDLMEMDIRQTKGNESFRVDGCITWIRAVGTIASKYGSEYEIDRSLGYE